MILQSTVLQRFKSLNFLVYLNRYIGDWILSFSLIGIAAYLQFFTEPFNRHFDINDPTINFPFAVKEQFDPARLFRYSVFLPLLIFTVWHGIKFSKNYKLNSSNDTNAELVLRTIHNYHILILSFVIGLSLNALVTEFLKNLISKPRPDFIERCGVNLELLKPNKVNYDSSICSKPYGQEVYKDGFKSSPSGHSSFAFTGLGYLALWLMGQLKILSQNTSKAQYRPTYLKLIPLIPILLACKIAISRTQDYRHHFKDILLGSLLGIINCYFNYFWFFNKLDDKMSENLIFDDDYKLLSHNSYQLETHDVQDIV